MNFEKHAFISYAHIDNQPIREDDEGWISNFHTSLESLVSMKLGENVHIWRDNKLKGMDIFSDEIVQQFPKTALLISVITPRYINSEWCTKEIKEFYQCAIQNIGVKIKNKSRILKVVKTPVDRDKIPLEMEGSLGYEFFKLDENGRPKEFNKVFGGDAEQAYLNRVDDLAYDVQELLNLLTKNEAEQGPDTDTFPASKKVVSVYLAQSSYDLSSERDMLVRELRDHGYTVFPDKPLSITEDVLKQEVADYLEQSQLAIHLVGKSYGGVPDGPSQKSTTILQNEIAALQSKKSGLPRVIWLPPGAEFQDEKQQRFVAFLNENQEAHYGADLVEGSLEDLKAVMHDKIIQLENPVEPEELTVVDPDKKVYVICDARDREQTFPLRKYLIEQGFEVTIPLFDGEPSAIRLDQEENLRNCDAVILFYGKGDEFWKRSKVNELKKINSYGRSKPLLATYTYLADPSMIDKEEMVALGMPNLMNGLQGFSADLMQDFMKKVLVPATK
ncbi:MAG: hypothetical protein RIG62_17685 [Cyclobacteriaceae bacterium]